MPGVLYEAFKDWDIYYRDQLRMKPPMAILLNFNIDIPVQVARLRETDYRDFDD